MIFPHNNAEFVADMERVLSIYKRPYDEKYPVVCFDEMPRQLIGDIQTMHDEVAAWEKERKNKHSVVDWQFTFENVRIKLNRLYPVIN